LMTPDPAMPKAMQITSLKRIFTGLNPGVGVDLIDWIAHVEEALTLPENRLELSIEYPQHRWFTDEEEMKTVKREALKETEELLDYMLTAVPEEARADFKTVFDDYLSRIRYSVERKLTVAPLKKQIAELRKQLEKASQEARRAGRPEPTKKEIEEHVKVPPTPRPPAWTTRLEKKLEDIFKATFTREGLSPTRYMPEYRLELDIIKTLTTEDEMVTAVEALAAEIVQREKVRKITPPRLREERPPPERPYRLPPEYEEERPDYGDAYAAPSYPPHSMSEMPFPRLPAGIELDLIEDKFIYDLMNCGIYSPELFLPQYRSKFAEVLFKSWDDMRKAYDLLVESICKGLEVRYPAEYRALPYESIEDAVYWLVSQKRFESAEEIAAEMYDLGTPATAEEVRIFIRRGWEDKVPNFVIVTRDYLEKLLGEPLQ